MRLLRRRTGRHLSVLDGLLTASLEHDMVASRFFYSYCVVRGAYCVMPIGQNDWWDTSHPTNWIAWRVLRIARDGVCGAFLDSRLRGNDSGRGNDRINVEVGFRKEEYG